MSYSFENSLRESIFREDLFLYNWFQLHYHDAGSVPARHPNGRGRFWEDDSSLATPTPVQQSDVSDANYFIFRRGMTPQIGFYRVVQLNLNLEIEVQYKPLIKYTFVPEEIYFICRFTY